MEEAASCRTSRQESALKFTCLFRYEAAYQDTRSWVIREFTELLGGCTVLEDVGGHYLSQQNEIVDDRVSMIYCDFPLNWNSRVERNEALEYCSKLQRFLLANLWAEAILIAAHPVSHTQQ